MAVYRSIGLLPKTECHFLRLPLFFCNILHPHLLRLGFLARLLPMIFIIPPHFFIYKMIITAQTRTELRGRGSTRSNRKHFKGTIITHKHRLQTHTQMLAALRPIYLGAQHHSRWNQLGFDFWLREENRSTQRKILKVRLRSTNLSPHAEPRIRTRVVEVGGANDYHCANLLP